MKKIILAMILMLISTSSMAIDWRYAAVRASDNMQVDLDYDSVHLEDGLLAITVRLPSEKKGLKTLFSDLAFTHESYGISCSENTAKWLSSKMESKNGQLKTQFSRKASDLEGTKISSGSMLDQVKVKVCKEFSAKLSSSASSLLPGSIDSTTWKYITTSSGDVYTFWLSTESIKPLGGDITTFVAKLNYKTPQSFENVKNYSTALHEIYVNCKLGTELGSAYEFYDFSGKLVGKYAAQGEDLSPKYIVKNSIGELVQPIVCSPELITNKKDTGAKVDPIKLDSSASKLLPNGIKADEWTYVTESNDIDYYVKNGSFREEGDVVWFTTGADYKTFPQSPGGQPYKYQFEVSYINCKTHFYVAGDKELFNEAKVFIEGIPAGKEPSKEIVSEVGKKIQQVVCNLSANKPSISNTDQDNNYATGTSWQISKSHLITAYHVVDGASSIAIVIGPNDLRVADIISYDASNDLAVLKIQGAPLDTNPLQLAQKPSKLGSKVAVIGYPLPDILGSKLQATSGEVSALFGLNNDPRFYQISAAVQSGNSGGPVLNQSGEVIGVVASKLNDIEILKKRGELPQNVNFAVKNLYVQSLVESLNIKVAKSQRKAMSIEDVIEQVKGSVFMVITSTKK